MVRRMFQRCVKPFRREAAEPPATGSHNEATAVIANREVSQERQAGGQITVRRWRGGAGGPPSRFGFHPKCDRRVQSKENKIVLPLRTAPPLQIQSVSTQLRRRDLDE